MMMVVMLKMIMYPCSTKTREVLGNPSPTPKRFPETREISRGRSPREILRVEGNLSAVRDGFPNTSLVLVEHGYIPALWEMRTGFDVVIDQIMLCGTESALLG